MTIPFDIALIYVCSMAMYFWIKRCTDIANIPETDILATESPILIPVLILICFSGGLYLNIGGFWYVTLE